MLPISWRSKPLGSGIQGISQKAKVLFSMSLQLCRAGRICLQTFCTIHHNILCQFISYLLTSPQTHVNVETWRDWWTFNQKRKLSMKSAGNNCKYDFGNNVIIYYNKIKYLLTLRHPCWGEFHGVKWLLLCRQVYAHDPQHSILRLFTIEKTTEGRQKVWNQNNS